MSSSLFGHWKVGGCDYPSGRETKVKPVAIIKNAETTGIMRYRRRRKRSGSSTSRRQPTNKELTALRNEQIRKLAKKSLATLRDYLDPQSQIHLDNLAIAIHEQKREELIGQLTAESSERVKRRQEALKASAKYEILRQDHKERWGRYKQHHDLSRTRTFWGSPTPEAKASLQWIEEYHRIEKQLFQVSNEFAVEANAIAVAENKLLQDEIAALPALPRRHKIPPEPLVREAIELRERHDSLRVAAAKNASEQRDLASTIIASLPKNHPCPYCGGDLGATPHADHIYPVSKGGQSTHVNLVFVCMQCNLRKSDLTLRAFAKTFAYDYMAIERRLEDLGKEF
jgi:5-methylcytosine-specific restriction endonuclease McrA